MTAAKHYIVWLLLVVLFTSQNVGPGRLLQFALICLHMSCSVGVILFPEYYKQYLQLHSEVH